MRELILEGPKSTIVDYDEYKTKILQIVKDQDLDIDDMRALRDFEKQHEKHKMMIEETHKKYRNNNLTSDDYLRRMINEKEFRKQQIEEIQNREYKKKFVLLSDENLCVSKEFKDPLRELALYPEIKTKNTN